MTYGFLNIVWGPRAQTIKMFKDILIKLFICSRILHGMFSASFRLLAKYLLIHVNGTAEFDKFGQSLILAVRWSRGNSQVFLTMWTRGFKSLTLYVLHVFRLKVVSLLSLSSATVRITIRRKKINSYNWL